MSPSSLQCRFCGAPLRTTFLDLGSSPLCQTHIAADQLHLMEPFYPLHAYVCEACFLVQLQEYVAPEGIFTEYAYFSSFSASWVDHARRYVEQVVERFALSRLSMVMEIASNDGYLLQHFVARGVPVLGIEPAANVARAAEAKGIPTRVAFFGSSTAEAIAAEHGCADLLLGNNVLAHVPNLNDFAAGMKRLLAPGGVITMEFPHLARLIAGNQFDTIYHEHFSYFSFVAVERVFARHGLVLFDVEELPTHGGSLRIYARHAENAALPVGASVTTLRRREIDDGFETIDRYGGFAEQVNRTKRCLLAFLIEAKDQGKSDRRIRCSRQGQHVAELLRNPYRPDRFHGGREPVQAGKVHAGNAHPDPGSLGDRRGTAGLRPDTALEPAGGDQPTSRIYRRLGWTLCRADPRGPGVRPTGRLSVCTSSRLWRGSAAVLAKAGLKCLSVGHRRSSPATGHPSCRTLSCRNNDWKSASEPRALHEHRNRKRCEAFAVRRRAHHAECSIGQCRIAGLQRRGIPSRDAGLGHGPDVHRLRARDLRQRIHRPNSGDLPGPCPQ